VSKLDQQAIHRFSDVAFELCHACSVQLQLLGRHRASLWLRQAGDLGAKSVSMKYRDDVAAEQHIGWYRRMQLLRRFEERARELVDEGAIAGPVHEYLGQEAVAVGICAALDSDDVITSTHRGHGHILAKGGDPARMYAELLGRETGYNKGRGGSMHIADLELGIYGANGIVGAGAPIACGVGKAFLNQGRNRVAVPFFGDGAMNQGVLLESFNLAVVQNLPVVFVCENNGYAITSPVGDMTRADLSGRAAGFGLNAQAVDGMDVGAVHACATQAVARARAGDGPSFLECRTYRYSVHNIATGAPRADARSAEEQAEWRARDAIDGYARLLEASRVLSAEARAALDTEVENLLEGAIGFARNSPRPKGEDALAFMYAETYPDFPAWGAPEGTVDG